MIDMPDEMREILATADPDEMVLPLLAHIFKMVTEIDATVSAMAPILGAIAGRVGITPARVAQLARQGVPPS
jgi:hypothetical protein